MERFHVLPPVGEIALFERIPTTSDIGLPNRYDTTPQR